MAIATISPATGELIKGFDALTDPQIAEKIRVAKQAFPKFRALSFAERRRMMRKVADRLEAEKDELAKLMTLEMGKTLRSAVDEAVEYEWACRYYAENAEKFLADELIEPSAKKSFIRYQAVGIVPVIMPWSYPFWQVFRFIAPGLMARNVGLLKDASNVPQCALKVEELLLHAGFPEGAFQTLLIDSSKVDAILADSRIAAATLAESEDARIKVGAGAASRIKKVVLELGGSDPFIVMPSANLDEAIATGVKARTLNNGNPALRLGGLSSRKKSPTSFRRQLSRKGMPCSWAIPSIKKRTSGPWQPPTRWRVCTATLKRV